MNRSKILSKDLLGRTPHSPEESRSAGKALRSKVPRERHSESAADSRRDPVDILLETNRGRVPELVPIRHRRMLASPFAFMRGAAAIMAADLARTSVSGIRVQACGDCHLMNFGAFGTAERQMNFDINDFDETLPAPWEWDLKRLAASFVVAGRESNLADRDAIGAAESAVRSYRKRIDLYAGKPALEVWYDHIDVEQAIAEMPPATGKRMSAAVAKARTHTVAEDCFPKLVESRNGRPRIKDNPPLIFHRARFGRMGLRAAAVAAFKAYRSTLDDFQRVLIDRFGLYDLAVKVVGAGSVGTLCMVMLFMASDQDPLFIQIKQANASVLEPYAGKSIYENHGKRIVMGQRLMQAAGDMMLGWTAGELGGRHFYLRQMHDMKFSPAPDEMGPAGLKSYAKLCGWTLARAHARSGDAAMIAGYLGSSDVFDRAMVKFATAYADQTEEDWRAMRRAARAGRIKVASRG
jgi:uncharacterized protein (DUF2252 family)